MTFSIARLGLLHRLCVHETGGAALMTILNQSDADLFQQAVKLVGGRMSAYADLPGSGPAGKTCKVCKHHVAWHYHNKIYNKCGLLKMTCGAATDIRVRMPACAKFEDEPA